MAFVIDADILVQMASICNDANDSVNSAVQSMNAVLAHDGWYCREKVQIDEAIANIKSRGLEIQEGFNLFSTAVTNVSENCLEMLREEETEMAKIESDIGSLLSSFAGNVNASVMSGTNTSSTITGIQSTCSNIDVMTTVATATEGIQIVDFPDI